MGLTDERIVELLGFVRRILRGPFAAGLSGGADEALNAAIERFGVCDCDDAKGDIIPALAKVRGWAFCPACGRRLEVPDGDPS